MVLQPKLRARKVTKSQYLLLKFDRVSSLALGNHMYKVISQHKRHSFSPHTKLALEVAQDVAKVNVEQLRRESNYRFKIKLLISIE